LQWWDSVGVHVWGQVTYLVTVILLINMCVELYFTYVCRVCNRGFSCCGISSEALVYVDAGTSTAASCVLSVTEVLVPCLLLLSLRVGCFIHVVG
jgi:hypothetical protein